MTKWPTSLDGYSVAYLDTTSATVYIWPSSEVVSFHECFGYWGQMRYDVDVVV